MYRYHIYVRATRPSKEALFLRVYCHPSKRKRKRNPLPEYFPPRFLFTKQMASSTRVRTAMAPISPMNQPCVAMSSYKPEYSAHRSHTLRAGDPQHRAPSGEVTPHSQTHKTAPVLCLLPGTLEGGGPGGHFLGRTRTQGVLWTGNGPLWLGLSVRTGGGDRQTVEVSRQQRKRKQKPPRSLQVATVTLGSEFLCLFFFLVFVIHVC